LEEEGEEEGITLVVFDFFFKQQQKAESSPSCNLLPPFPLPLPFPLLLLPASLSKNQCFPSVMACCFSPRTSPSREREAENLAKPRASAREVQGAVETSTVSTRRAAARLGRRGLTLITRVLREVDSAAKTFGEAGVAKAA